MATPRSDASISDRGSVPPTYHAPNPIQNRQRFRFWSSEPGQASKNHVAGWVAVVCNTTTPLQQPSSETSSLPLLYSSTDPASWLPQSSAQGKTHPRQLSRVSHRPRANLASRASIPDTGSTSVAIYLSMAHGPQPAPVFECYAPRE